MIMEDYNINFQEILDKMTLQEIKQFHERLGEEFDRRLAKKTKELEQEWKVLNYLSK